MEAIAAGVTSFEALLVDDDVERALARYGRLAELVIIGQDDSTDPDAVAPAGFADRVMLGASHPLLVVPAEGAIETTGKDILVGWDTSRSHHRRRHTDGTRHDDGAPLGFAPATPLIVEIG